MKAIVAFSGSTALLWGIVGLFTLQAAWFAVSFDYGMVFDERYHFNITKAYTEQLGPIIYDQSPRLDFLRDLENEGPFLYHYVMSFPLRAVAVFTDDMMTQVILLRLLNVAFATAALIIFAKLLLLTGIRRIYINFGLLIFTLIPIFPYLSATINYDNLLLLVAATYLLAWIVYLKNDPWDISRIATIMLLGLIGSLIKATFLPVVAASVLVLVWYLYKHRYLLRWDRVKINYIKTSVWLRMFVLALLTGAAILFSLTYIKNIVVYGSPQPNCNVTLGAERCTDSAIIRRSNMVMATRGERSPEPPSEYVTLWVNTMLTEMSLVRVGNQGAINARPQQLPIITEVIFFGSLLAIVFIAMQWRMLTKTKEHKFLWLIAVVVIGSVFLKTASGYYTHYTALAIQPRYLFMIFPIILVFAVMAYGATFKKYKAAGVVGAIVILALLTQGGGMTSYLLRSNPTWFHENATVQSMNESLREVVSPFVREHAGKYGI